MEAALKGSFKFEQDNGCAAELGKYYEQRVIAFTLIKALISDVIHDYILINNPREECAPFDDIILLTKRKEQHEIYLFQIKFKQTPTLILDSEFTPNNQKSKFCMKMMYKRYCKAKQNIEKLLKGARFEDYNIKIIIFTNRAMDPNTQIFEPLNVPQSFSVRGGVVYKFRKSFIDGCQLKDEKRFLKCISIYANQTDENIDKESMSDIKTYLQTKMQMEEKIKFEFFNCIKNWCQIRVAKIAINKKFTQKLLVCVAFKAFEVRIDECNQMAYQKYASESVDLLWESIKANHLEISTEHVQFVLGKARQDLNNLENIDTLKDYLYLKEILSTDALNLTRNENQFKYYIGCMLGKLPFIVRNFNLTVKRENVEDLKIIFIEEHANKPSDLARIAEATLTLLKQKTITTIIGQTFTIQNVIDEIPSEISVTSLLSLLIDCNMCNEEDNGDIFIESRFRKVLMDDKIFTSVEDKFVIGITGITTQEFVSRFEVNTNLFTITTNSNNITLEPKTPSCSKNATQAINTHFLKCENFKDNTWQLEWIKTIGSTQNIREFRTDKLCATTTNEISYCNCCVKFQEAHNYFQNSFLVISGAPDVGKTSCLKRFVRCTSSNYFLFVNLMDHEDYYINLLNDKKSATAREHLNQFYASYNESCDVLMKFFASKLENKNITILIDGFDETPPRFIEIVCEIIKQISNEEYKIILSTRSVLQDKVEQTFDTFVIKLSPFNKTEQMQFLQSYFGNDAESISKITNYIPIDIEFFSMPLGLKLISKFLSSNTTIRPEEIFEEFYKQKLEIYKKRINSQNIESKIDRDLKRVAIRMALSNLSNYSYDKQVVDNILEEIIYDFKEGEKKLGILLMNGENNVYIYQSIAKHFVKRWLSDVQKENSLSILGGRENDLRIQGIIRNIPEFQES